jgi:hypothetical protein
MNAGVFGAARISVVDLDDQRTNHVRLANPTHQHPRRTRTPSHPHQATMVGEYEQLAVQYLEMARGITGDPSKARLHASIGNASAGAERERRKGPPFASDSSRRPLRPNQPMTYTDDQLERKVQKSAFVFSDGLASGRASQLISVSGILGVVFWVMFERMSVCPTKGRRAA